jgi:hypothetical protein
MKEMTLEEKIGQMNQYNETHGMLQVQNRNQVLMKKNII